MIPRPNKVFTISGNCLLNDVLYLDLLAKKTQLQDAEQHIRDNGTVCIMIDICQKKLRDRKFGPLKVTQKSVNRDKREFATK